MMVPDDRHNGIRKLNGGQEIGTDVGMELHLVEFGICELPGLVQDMFGDRELTHVMKKRRCLDGPELPLVRYSEPLRQFDRVDLHPTNMAMCDLVFGIDGHREGFDRGQIEIAELFDMTFRILDSTERRTVREIRDKQNRKNDCDSTDINGPRVRH